MSKSSGARWSEAEDQRLYDELKEMVARFPGRSFAAILSRIDYLKALWWVKWEQ